MYTIKKYGKFSSVKRNVAVEGVTVNKTEVPGGIGFTVSQTKTGFSKDGSRRFDPDEMQKGTQSDGSSIQLPTDALGNGNGDSSNGKRNKI